MPQSLPRPDDPTTRRRAAIAGGEPRHVLAAAGAWLREADPEVHEEAKAAIATLRPELLAAALGGIDVGACADALAMAANEAFEVAFEEDEEERESLEEATLLALEERDEAESSLVAVEWALGRPDAPREVAALRETASAVREALSAIDVAARRGARPLTAINERRRLRAQALAPAHREVAWWFSHLSGPEHDGLVEALAGLEGPVGEAARADAARAAIPPRGVTFGAALRSLEVGPSRADDEPGARWARAEAERSESAAVALHLTRTLRVEDLGAEDLDASAVDQG